MQPRNGGRAGASESRWKRGPRRRVESLCWTKAHGALPPVKRDFKRRESDRADDAESSWNVVVRILLLLGLLLLFFALVASCEQRWQKLM